MDPIRLATVIRTLGRDMAETVFEVRSVMVPPDYFLVTKRLRMIQATIVAMATGRTNQSQPVVVTIGNRPFAFMKTTSMIRTTQKAIFVPAARSVLEIFKVTSVRKYENNPYYIIGKGWRGGGIT